MGVKFYLGTHLPHWLWSERFRDTPLFVSRTTLLPRKNFYPAQMDWGLDSGAFTELLKYGRWTIPPRQYADFCLRCQDQIGRMDFCSIQDWMCEQQIIDGGWISGAQAPGTKLSLLDHQRRTVDSYLELKSLEPGLPWLPVLQGFTEEDYFRCHRMYADAGVDLTGMWVGIGSVCRRQGTNEIAAVLKSLSSLNMRMHGFGVKVAGLAKSAAYLYSADSMAWSYGARRGKIKMPICVERGAKHRNCSSCPEYAFDWLNRLIAPAIRVNEEQACQNGSVISPVP